MTIYSESVRRDFQRPKHFVEGLESRPWWPTSKFEAAVALEENYESIRQEFERVVLSGRLKFHPQSPGGPRETVATGAWKIFELFSSGRRNHCNASEAPITSGIIERFQDIITHPHGLVYFSVVGGGVRIKPHFGPTNTRLRIHLGLSVPPGAKIRAGPETHINESPMGRGVLIVDIWHPDLSREARRSMMAARKSRASKKNLQRGGWI
jgi:aspartate beta-hydroxylase